MDAFVAPERGTSWADHLIPGLASVGIVLAALVLYPRARDGLRAVLALVLGVLALVGAALSVASARGQGPFADDWTGFLLLPAGLVLLGVGAHVLWRSRKRGGRRFLRRGLLAAGAVLVAYWAVLPVGIALIATHRPRAVVEPPDLGRPYEEVTLRTSDGLELAAWYVPARNGAAVISFPTRMGKPEHARMLADHGYGVLLVDMRGYDGSEGAPNAFGWGAAPDIDAAVAWLERRPDVDDGRIGGIGFSVGGEMMLEAAASNAGLEAVVSEGAGWRSIRESPIRGSAGVFALPLEAVQTAALAVLSGTRPPESLEDLVGRISPRPLFLIYSGRADEETFNPAYFEAAAEPKEIWHIPEAAHVGGLAARPAEYERRVVDFFDAALLAED
jgi:fermentation-respiration switch protein FrsA (DUF1100 family)